MNKWIVLGIVAASLMLAACADSTGKAVYVGNGASGSLGSGSYYYKYYPATAVYSNFTANCTNDCSPTGNTCSGNYIRSCGNFDADRCLDLRSTYCANGCSNGACRTNTTQPNPNQSNSNNTICVDSCVNYGSKTCSGNYVRYCGNFDADSCLELGPSIYNATLCPTGNQSGGNATNNTYFCSDSDSGINYAVQGKVTSNSIGSGEGSNGWDYCFTPIGNGVSQKGLTGTNLLEWYCTYYAGLHVARQNITQCNCYDGRCIESGEYRSCGNLRVNQTQYNYLGNNTYEVGLLVANLTRAKYRVNGEITDSNSVGDIYELVDGAFLNTTKIVQNASTYQVSYCLFK